MLHLGLYNWQNYVTPVKVNNLSEKNLNGTSTWQCCCVKQSVNFFDEMETKKESFWKLLTCTYIKTWMARAEVFPAWLSSWPFLFSLKKNNSARKSENEQFLPLRFFFLIFPCILFSVFFWFLWGEYYFFFLKWTTRKKNKVKKAGHQKKSGHTWLDSAKLSLVNFSSNSSLD